MKSQIIHLIACFKDMLMTSIIQMYLKEIFVKWQSFVSDTNQLTCMTIVENVLQI